MSAMVFGAIEGLNPLGFLAVLGAFRLSGMLWQGVRLRWVRDGGWRPEILGLPPGSDGEFCRTLHEQAPWAPEEPFMELGNNITVPGAVFGAAVSRAVKGMTAEDVRAAEFAASFGCELLEDEDKGRIEYTDFCFITGSGHQDFLGTARGLARSVKPEHLQEALFGPWRYKDKSLSMRWDPDDAKEYALRWRDPSVGGAWAVWGANRLAFEALPLFPTVPTERGLRTTGFRVMKRVHEFTWPIWTEAASLDTVRALLGMGELESDVPDRMVLGPMGVAEVYRAERVRIGQGANFKVSFRPARAV